MSTNLRRFGVLVPPGNVVVEDEFPRYLPDGLQMHVARMYRRSRSVTYDSLTEMLESVEAVTRGLALTLPEAILFACTSASFKDGLGEDRKLAAKISSAANGVPALCTSTALVDALRHVGARKVFLVTPYIEDLNKREEVFFDQAGFTLTGTASFLYEDTVDIRNTPSSEVAKLVLANRKAAEAADAVFISCTNLHAMDQLAALEATLGRPVLCSNQCTLWAGFNALGVSGAGRNGGSLLDGTARARAAAAE